MLVHLAVSATPISARVGSAPPLGTPEDVAAELGVREVDEIQVRCADGRSVPRKLVADVLVELLGRKATFRASIEPNRYFALIGVIVLEEFDLLVDCTTEKLRPRDPNHIISEIE